MRALGLSLFVAAGLAGCMDELPPEENTTPIAKGACTALEGLSFRSLTQGECGLTPNGVAYCNWSIRFETYDGETKSRFTWSHSDVGESGMATCDGNVIRAEGAGTTVYEGTYDEATDQLVWDNLAYAPN